MAFMKFSIRNCRGLSSNFITNSRLLLLLICLANPKYTEAKTKCQNPHNGEQFAAVSQCGSNNYKDACKVSTYNNNLSCLCDGTDNFFYLCLGDCNDAPFRVDGQCVQCFAGSFFGYFNKQSSYDGQGDSRRRAQSYCSKSIDTADGSYWFDYVCNHNAANDADPRNVAWMTGMSQYCTECPAGTYNWQGGQVCQACSPGYYSNTAGSPTCSQCLPGTYANAVSGATACDQCPSGMYQDSYGQTTCKACPPGTIAGAPGNSQCTQCQGGSYQPNSNSTGCINADLGHYSSGSGSTTQYPCPYGSYTDVTGSSACTLCPQGQSTYQIGSTDSSDCKACPYGVDPNTLACSTSPAELDDVCWNAGQTLSLNSSVAAQDLFTLMFQMENVGISALLNMTVDVIQRASLSEATVGEIEAVHDALYNATTNWFNARSSNLPSCISSVSQEIRSMADSNSVEGVSLLEYQFGSDVNPSNWQAYWHCTGATFGCVGDDITTCPQAHTAFAFLYQGFSPLLSFPGGATPFGTSSSSTIGRYTPVYSPSYIANKLEANINSLLQWEDTVNSFEQYLGIMDAIATSTEEIESFTASSIDALLQVQNVQVTSSLSSSYIQGNLFYAQSQFDANMLNSSAAVVQKGPEYCDDSGCITWNELINDCQREMRIESAFKIIGATIKIAAGLIDPVAFFTEEKKGESAPWSKTVKVMQMGNELDEAGLELNEAFTNVVGVGSWTPATEMPSLPELGSNGTALNPEYEANCSAYYLQAERNMSKSLTGMSPAYWDSIYLENEKTVGPIIEDPPSCEKWKTEIVDALNEYLANVKNMTNYGNAMTTSFMSLVPILGDISTGLSTVAAIQQASANISGTASHPDPTITTAPEDYQTASDVLFYSTFTDATKNVLAYTPSLALLLKQYTSSKSIFGFCRSYEYMNSGLQYVNKNADCSSFGNYLPTTTTFYAVLSSFVDNSFNSIIPSPINKLTNNINQFANQVQSDPTAVGQAQGSYSKDEVKSFAIEFSEENSFRYYGNLTNDGSTRFSLTPSSDILSQSLSSFGINLVNPRVINVQAYWRGVTSPTNQMITSYINVGGPMAIYPESGVGANYFLPMLNTSSNPDFFASNAGIEVNELTPCQTDVQKTEVTWMDGSVTYICTDISSDAAEQPATNFVSNAFLFPSLWATWQITVEKDVWNGPFIDKDPKSLALQVVFQFISSSTDSYVGSTVCYNSCYEKEMPYAWNGPNPLNGEEWCDQNDCSSCNAMFEINGTQLTTDGFCLCNVWNGDSSICLAPSPASADSSTFSIITSPSTNSRQLKEKSGKQTKSAKSKPDFNVHKLKLQGVLEDSLVSQCLHSAASDASVVVDQCESRGKLVDCDFYVQINYNSNAASDQVIKAHVDFCTKIQLMDDKLKLEIAHRTGSCYVSAEDNKNKRIGEALDQCD